MRQAGLQEGGVGEIVGMALPQSGTAAKPRQARIRCVFLPPGDTGQRSMLGRFGLQKMVENMGSLKPRYPGPPESPRAR